MGRVVLFLILLTLGTSALVWSQALDSEPEFLGAITRNAQGQVVAVPQAAASQVDSPAPGTSTTLHVGSQQALHTIAAAAAIAKNGDTVEIDAGEYLADVAVWRQDRLTLRGVGGKVRLVANGASAQGKAIWVIAGGQITVENISFNGAKVPERNGAGIRFEQGQLTIKNCSFLNNENGILTANHPDAELIIENSEFGYNGAGDGYSHNLYAGRIKKLTVTGSYFHHAKVGHLLKSRAAENRILYNRLTDEPGGSASYELEFPNGGLAYVVGNIIEQSATTQNPVIVSYGAEGYTWPQNELYLSYNTLVDDYPSGGRFLRYQRGLGKLLAVNNVLVGHNEVLASNTDTVQADHNISLGSDAFVDVNRFDYRPKPSAIASFKVQMLQTTNGVELEASRMYVHPMSTRKLNLSALLPGAVQTR